MMDCGSDGSDVAREHGISGGGAAYDISSIDYDRGECRLVHDGASTRIYRLDDPNNATFGGRTGAVAIKVASSSDRRRPHPTPSSVGGLYDEYILTRRPNSLLSGCSAVRGALGHAEERDGTHSIILEWADGVTLREWIRLVHNRWELPSPSSTSCFFPRPVLLTVVRLAWTIAGALFEMHESGVVHNGITQDNIIVDDKSSWDFTGLPNNNRREHEIAQNGTDENPRRGAIQPGEEFIDNFSIKIIDLGSATLLTENDPSGTAEAIARDLVSLGEVFCEMFFLGCVPPANANRASNHFARCGVGTDEVVKGLKFSPQANREFHHDHSDALHQSGIPRCISTLAAKLMGRGGYCHASTGRGYRSCGEVRSDLAQILDFPDRFLVTDSERPERVTRHLPSFLPDRLYGRAAETTMLLHAFSRVTAARNHSEIVLISGASGSGKSSLVRNVQDSFIERGGYLASGKFDSLQQVESLSAIIDAFSGFCHKIMEGCADRIDQMRAAIMEKVGLDGGAVLAGLIPGLGRLLGIDPRTTAVEVGGKEAQNRLKHVFRLFVRAIAGPSRPLVLFCDDLQWADLASLDLIKAMVEDHECNSFLFIGCYRDNEIDSVHPLSMHLREVERLSVPIMKIGIGNISSDAMNHFISDTICALRSCTTSLTDAVYHKTNGNTFFAIEFLSSLCEKGLLKFSSVSGSWEWDIDGILSQSNDVANTAFDLILGKVLALPDEVAGALQVVACLGHHCEESTLRIIADEEDAGVRHSPDGKLTTNVKSNGGICLVDMLDTTVKKGLLERIGSKYFFVHDQIQNAVYSSIAQNKRGMLHYKIGKRIWKKSPTPKLSELLFVAADQLYLGSMFVAQEDRIELAGLYLRAGKKAMALSLFLPARTYLKAGMDVLEPGHWEHEYNLSLQLYLSCAEACFYNGDLELGHILDEIFANAKCFYDKVGAYRTLVDSLGSLDKVQDAIHTSFLVLEELGEIFPGPDDASHHCVSNWILTRNMLEEYTDETLVTLQVMEDERKISAMGFLNNLILYTYMAAPQYLSLVTFRMMQLSLQYGLCKESAFGFVMYGIHCISCEPFKDIDRGYQFGQLALQLLQRFDGKDSVAQVYTSIYGNVHHWKEHLCLSLEPLMRGYQVGLMHGDIVYGMANARILCLHSFLCGKKLAPLEEDMRLFCDKMTQYSQMTMLAFLAVTRQTVHNLMGLADDPLQLTGEAMNQEKMLENAIQKNNSLIACCIYYHRMWLAYFFRDYKLASVLAEKSRNIDKLCTSEFAVPNHAFFDGLTSFALARKTGRSKWKRRAKEALESMKIWAPHAPCNFSHKCFLLEAESAFLSEEHSLAEKMYESAIDMARENGFVNDRALACERAALFHMEIGEKSRASAYYDQAHDLYLEWGARGKALHLRGQPLSSLIAENTSQERY